MKTEIVKRLEAIEKSTAVRTLDDIIDCYRKAESISKALYITSAIMPYAVGLEKTELSESFFGWLIKVGEITATDILEQADEWNEAYEGTQDKRILDRIDELYNLSEKLQ